MHNDRTTRTIETLEGGYVYLAHEIGYVPGSGETLADIVRAGSVQSSIGDLTDYGQAKGIQVIPVGSSLYEVLAYTLNDRYTGWEYMTRFKPSEIPGVNLVCVPRADVETVDPDFLVCDRIFSVPVEKMEYARIQMGRYDEFEWRPMSELVANPARNSFEVVSLDGYIVSGFGYIVPELAPDMDQYENHPVVREARSIDPTFILKGYAHQRPKAEFEVTDPVEVDTLLSEAEAVSLTEGSSDPIKRVRSDAQKKFLRGHFARKKAVLAA